VNAKQRRSVAAALGAGLKLLRQHRATIVECHSSLRQDGRGGIKPVPGTLDAAGQCEVNRHDAAISKMEAAQRKLRDPA
jgi:hypothetical protein